MYNQYYEQYNRNRIENLNQIRTLQTNLLQNPSFEIFDQLAKNWNMVLDYSTTNSKSTRMIQNPDTTYAQQITMNSISGGITNLYQDITTNIVPNNIYKFEYDSILNTTITNTANGIGGRLYFYGPGPKSWYLALDGNTLDMTAGYLSGAWVFVPRAVDGNSNGIYSTTINVEPSTLYNINASGTGSGLGGTNPPKITIYEYDINGAYLGSTAVLNFNQGTYSSTQFTNTFTTRSTTTKLYVKVRINGGFGLLSFNNIAVIKNGTTTNLIPNGDMSEQTTGVLIHGISNSYNRPTVLTRYSLQAICPSSTTSISGKFYFYPVTGTTATVTIDNASLADTSNPAINLLLNPSFETYKYNDLAKYWATNLDYPTTNSLLTNMVVNPDTTFAQKLTMNSVSGGVTSIGQTIYTGIIPGLTYKSEFDVTLGTATAIGRGIRTYMYFYGPGPTSWYLYSGGVLLDRPTAFWDNIINHSGTVGYSGRLDISGTTNSTSDYIITNYITAKHSTQYTVNIWGIVQNLGGTNPVKIKIYEYTTGSTTPVKSTEIITYNSLDTAWTQKTFTTLVTTATTGRIRIYVQMVGGYGQFWFDDIEVMEYGTTTNLVANPTMATTTTGVYYFGVYSPYYPDTVAKRVTLTGVAPPNTVSIRPFVYLYPNTGTTNTMIVDNALLEATCAIINPNLTVS